MKTRVGSCVGVFFVILMLFVGLAMLAALPAAGQERHDPVSGIDFVWVAEGCFRMGSPDSEAGRGVYEGPVHEVCVDGFWMGKYEVTQAQWEKVMGSNPSRFKWDSHPVENVSWNDAQEFLQTLNAQAGKEIYRLPTEAEWEYAARAGTETAYSFGDDAARLDEYAWYERNSERRTHPVGLLKPNPWGLYDMYGNVAEWCQDWYEREYYSQSPSKNPQGPQSGKYRVQRGGSWSVDPDVCRSAQRYSFTKPDTGIFFDGFRVVAGSGAEAQFLPPTPLKASEALVDTLDLNRVIVNTVSLSSPP